MLPASRYHVGFVHSTHARMSHRTQTCQQTAPCGGDGAVCKPPLRPTPAAPRIPSHRTVWQHTSGMQNDSRWCNGAFRSQRTCHNQHPSMDYRWGCVLALSVVGKGHGARAFLHKASTRAVMHDASYWRPTRLTIRHRTLLTMLRPLVYDSSAQVHTSAHVCTGRSTITGVCRHGWLLGRTAPPSRPLGGLRSCRWSCTRGRSGWAPWC